MTAYVNDEQKKEGAYGKAVKATLAATLAAGMVPAAAAFADEPAEAAEGNDVEVLAASAKDAWETGKFAVADNFGTAVEFKTDAAGNVKPAEFEADGRAHYLVPKTVDPAGVGAIEDLTDSKRYTVVYTKAADDASVETNHIKLSDLNKVGEYKVTVLAANDDYAGAKKEFFFNIVAGEDKVDAAEFYQKGDEGDFSDKTFEYAGDDIASTIGLVYNGKALVEGTDYKSIKFYDAAGNEVAVKNAGSYTAVITKKDDTTVKKSLAVSKLDLSKAKFTFAKSGDFKDRKVVEIDGIAKFKNAMGADVTVDQLFTQSLVSMPDVTKPNAKGEYVWTLTPNTDKFGGILANFEGVAKAVNVKADKTLGADIFAKYGKDTVAFENDTVDHSKGDADYDLSKVYVLLDNGKKLDKSFYTVTVLDQAGNEVDAAKLKEAGVWTVKVSIDAAKTEYLYAGEATAKITVKNGAVQSEDIVFALDGKVVSGTKAVTYTGEDFLSKVEASVKLGDKELVKGEDYTLKAVDGDNNVVESIVEAGTYTVSVESDEYEFAKGTNSLELVVNPATVNFVRIDPASLMLEGDTGLKVVYTGEAIAPKLQYATDSALKADTEWKDLPADAASLTFQYAKKADGKFESAKEMKELGFYELAVSDANSKDSINFGAGVKFEDFIKDSNNDGEADAAEALVYEVVKGKVYADVKPGDWFYQNVYDAQKAGYMSGIGSTDLFAPNQTTSRAMAATVLSRMAAKGGAKDDNYTNPFTDVTYVGVPEKDAWYAKAVLWAASTGVVTGYPGTTEFRPDANVTRAEFCIMMQRYAAATGQGVALAAGEADQILAKYEDGAAVADWAKEPVAWAVKNEIFGGYSVLNPAGDITRAEMAKMAVAFQAEPLK